MATTSAINALIDELASSIIPSSTARTRQRPRRAIEQFRKQVRHHNFARTNQFDVDNRLNGLEEKFQVLSREDLSDSLHDYRIELRQHEDRWIPDVLDLLLQLSQDPLQKPESANRSDSTSYSEAPTFLSWSEIEAEDPLDKHDPIWQIPSFSDSSSEGDDIEIPTASTSPASVEPNRPVSRQSNSDYQAHNFQSPNSAKANAGLQAFRVSAPTSNQAWTEIGLIRQMLLLMQGYDTNLLDMHNEQIRLHQHFKLNNVSNNTVEELLQWIQPIRSNLEDIIKWADKEHTVLWKQSTKHYVEKIVQGYVVSICMIEEDLLHPQSVRTTSLLDTITRLEIIGSPLRSIARWLRQTELLDPIASLEALFDLVCEAYYSGDISGTETILPMFLNAFESYMNPITKWIENGTLDTRFEPFFVQAKNTRARSSELWHDSFQFNLGGSSRPPSFLRPFVRDIFTCGKTVVFINHIKAGHQSNYGDPNNHESLSDKINDIASDPHIPFPAAFADSLSNYFTTMLNSKTSSLRQLLETCCGMTRTLDAYEYLYLRKQGALLDTLEGRIFSRIDRCVDNWNDRFIVADMLEDVYADVNCIDLQSITVQAVHTSSRAMESRRRSVRILSALAFNYALPWPIANIISEASLKAYRSIGLHLTQIRRAKYVLDRTAFTQVHSVAISDDPRDQHLAQTTTFSLLHFTNTLYDHFTTGVTLPLTSQMRANLQIAGTVDAMIAVHETYIANLEFVCLTNVSLKVLRETLVGLLDMCIRFADLVSTPADAARTRYSRSADHEAGSFVSAQSYNKKKQWRRLRSKRNNNDSADEASSDEDEFEDAHDSDAEGYSSFIVLDEDTSIAVEISKLRTQFQRQLDFFIAGLRGVGRGGGTGEEFGMLADRLDWKSRS